MLWCTNHWLLCTNWRTLRETLGGTWVLLCRFSNSLMPEHKHYKKVIPCSIPQIGMRSDSGIASVYDEFGVEIENAELLFTEEGQLTIKRVVILSPAVVSPSCLYQGPISSRLTAMATPMTRHRCGLPSSQLCSRKAPLHWCQLS